MANAQSQAIALANQTLQLAAQVQSLGLSVNQLVTQYNSTNAGAVWAALATAPVNTDGSLGAADGATNVAHPIDTRVVPTLNRAISSNSLTSLVTLLEAYQSFLSGAAVPTLARQSLIDQSCGG